MKKHNCESCRFRAQYDNNPASILGRIWRWHVNWCPGWKSYLKQLPTEKKELVIEKYNITH